MAFGWKVLIPFGLVWVLATGAIVVLPEEYGKRPIYLGAAIVLGVVVLASALWPLVAPKREGVRG